MSNRGRGHLKPTREERDAIVQLWMKRTDLATIGLYMESKGVRVLHMSSILRFCVETTMALILRAGGKYVSSTAMANEYLQDRTGVNLNPGGRANKNLVTNLLGDEGYNELPEPPRPEFSEETIAEIKRSAREQFRQSVEVEAEKEPLERTREEKDEQSFADQHKAFMDMIGDRIKKS
jgi:hypothetical protein